MDTSHSVCLNVDWLIFSITELNFEIADKLLPVQLVKACLQSQNLILILRKSTNLQNENCCKKN